MGKINCYKQRHNDFDVTVIRRPFKKNNFNASQKLFIIDDVSDSNGFENLKPEDIFNMRSDDFTKKVGENC